MKRVRRTLFRYHVWLGWLVGIPLLLWTASGLVMVAWPIEQVRGTDLRAELPPLPAATVYPPAIHGAADSLTLKQTALGPRWIVALGETRYAADPRDGSKLAALDRAGAVSAALGYRKPPAHVASARYSAAEHPPLDLRQPRPAWAVRFDDGARFYIDADTGELIAVRTDFWRFYDVMWGLHIMDLQGREDTHHPILIIFAGISALAAMLAVLLMIARYAPLRRKSR